MSRILKLPVSTEQPRPHVSGGKKATVAILIPKKVKIEQQVAIVLTKMEVRAGKTHILVMGVPAPHSDKDDERVLGPLLRNGWGHLVGNSVFEPFDWDFEVEPLVAFENLLRTCEMPEDTRRIGLAYIQDGTYIGVRFDHRSLV